MSSGPATDPLEPTEVVAFRAVCCFVLDIGQAFGSTQKSLALYKRLIEKTTPAEHAASVRRHLAAFREFSDANMDVLRSRDETFAGRSSGTTISYNDRVFINVKTLVRQADDDSRGKIWDHLITVASAVCPERGSELSVSDGGSLRASIRGTDKEDDLLRNIVTTVEASVRDHPTNATPTEAMSRMMGNGAIADLMGNMSRQVGSGELDVGKLMGSIKGMMGQMAVDDAANPELAQMTSSLKSMIESVEGMQAKQRRAPQ